MRPEDALQSLRARLAALVPGSAENALEGFESQVGLTLEALIARLDLVSREEFDAQVRVLGRTRERVEALELSVAELERQLHARQP